MEDALQAVVSGRAGGAVWDCRAVVSGRGRGAVWDCMAVVSGRAGVLCGTAGLW